MENFAFPWASWIVTGVSLVAIFYFSRWAGLLVHWNRRGSLPPAEEMRIRRISDVSSVRRFNRIAGFSLMGVGFAIAAYLCFRTGLSGPTQLLRGGDRSPALYGWVFIVLGFTFVTMIIAMAVVYVVEQRFVKRFEKDKTISAIPPTS